MKTALLLALAVTATSVRADWPSYLHDSSRVGRTEEPRMTRFLACQMARSHYYNLEAAYRELGYQVRVGLEEGMDQTVDYLRSLTP